MKQVSKRYNRESPLGQLSLFLTLSLKTLFLKKAFPIVEKQAPKNIQTYLQPWLSVSQSYYYLNPQYITKWVLAVLRNQWGNATQRNLDNFMNQKKKTIVELGSELTLEQHISASFYYLTLPL